MKKLFLGLVLMLLMAGVSGVDLTVANDIPAGTTWAFDADFSGVMNFDRVKFYLDGSSLLTGYPYASGTRMVLEENSNQVVFAEVNGYVLTVSVKGLTSGTKTVTAESYDSSGNLVDSDSVSFRVFTPASETDVSNLQSDLSSTNQNISNLGQDMSSLESNLSQDISSLESNLGEDISSLESNLGEDISSLESNLGENISSLESTAQSLSGEINSVSNSLQEQILSVSNEVTETKGSLDALNEDIEVYKDGKKVEIDTLKYEVNDAEAEISSLKEELEAVKKIQEEELSATGFITFGSVNPLLGILLVGLIILIAVLYIETRDNNLFSRSDDDDDDDEPVPDEDPDESIPQGKWSFKSEHPKLIEKPAKRLPLGELIRKRG